MIYQNILTQGTFILLLILTIIYFHNQKFDMPRNRIYKILLVMTGIVSAVEIAYMISIAYLKIEILSYILYKTDIVLQTTWWTILLLYYASLVSPKEYTTVREVVKNSKALLSWVAFSIIATIGFVLIKHTGMTIHTINFLHGASAYYLTVSAAIVEGIAFYIISKNKDKILKMERTAFYLGVIIVGLYVLLQYIFKSVSFLPACYALIVYIIYFCAENPDIQVNNEINKAQGDIEQSNHTKTDFLSNMTYEIKTPMNLISSLCDELINMPTFDEKLFREDIQQIVMSGNSLLDIVNNILDISRIETGKQVLIEKEYKVVDLLTDIVNITKSKIGSKPVKLMVNVDQNISSVVNGDYSKIYQVLVNILANAAKFTDVGRITITLSSNKVNDVENLLFKISDTGMGIKEEAQANIYEKGTKVDNSDSEIEGSGFGLAITKQYVETLNGKISFESKFRVGTTFYVEIPQKIVDATTIGNTVQQQTKPESNEKIDCSAFTALVVDDNLLNIKVAKRLLEGYKLNVESCTSGKDCVYKIKEGVKYDAIFMDHMMPEMDGIETLHVLKKLDGYDLPPIIALTANAVAGMKEMYLAEGFDDYLSKPINAAELDRVMNKYFKK